ncbi:unnamed protein product [Phaeothamnion confervicola]
MEVVESPTRSRRLYQYYGRAPMWRALHHKLEAQGVKLRASDNAVVKRLTVGETWLQQMPDSLHRSYCLQYELLKGTPSADDESIERDVMRTVRGETDGSGFLLDRSPGQKMALALALRRVLNGAAVLDHMGYVQGQNYVVDVLLKAGVCEEDAFCLFVYALRHQFLYGLYRTEVPILTDYLAVFERQLAARAPDLAAHLEREGFTSSIYAIEWFTTLFALSAPPLVTLAAMDLFFG